MTATADQDINAFEWTFYALVLALATGPLDHLILIDGISPTVRAALWASVYFVFTLLLVIRPTATVAALAGLWPVLCLMLLALASTVWSDHPQQTLSGTAETAATVWFGAVIGRRLGERRLLAMVVLVLGGLAGIDLWAVYGGPAGLDINGDAVGLFSHKNQNGAVMATLIVAGVAVLSWGGTRLPAMMGLLLAVPLCLLSGSRTAWAAALAGTAAVFLPALARLRPPARIAVFVTAVAVLCLGGALSLRANVDAVGSVLAVVGKDATLTGRTVLWDLAKGYVEQAPVLGHGFNGFWSEDPSSDAAYVNGLLKEDFASFHNGHLEMAVELGIAGAALQIAVVLAFLRPVRQLLRTGDRGAAAFALAFFAVIALTSSSEVVLFLRHGFDLLLMSALWSAAYRGKAP